MHATIGDYLIRDWTNDDAEAIVKYADNRKIAMNLRDGFPHPYRRADAEDFLGRVMQLDPRTVFAIAMQSEAIGGIGLMPGQDVHRLTAELGYWLAEPYWNRGIMTRAVIQIVDFAFTQLRLNRVFAEPYVTNLASARVLEKADFVREGVLRANVIKYGQVLDQFLYARVRSGLAPTSAIAEEMSLPH
jgi:[ribosomal protein S5]-alanine N-acetyltransferase